MKILADTHLHFYPCYDLKRALGVLRYNLAALGADSLHMAFLAERNDCHFFKEIRDKKREVSASPAQISDLGEALLLQEEGYKDLYLFAGRQVITRERLEVLALTTDVEIPDGLPVEEVIERINREGAIAVLSWAPGKWFAQRGKKVSRLLSDYSAQDLVLGDTTLRPWCWIEPLLMKKGVKSGFTVLAGSDPLPFAGEEEMMGRYVSSWQMALDTENPVASVRSYLKESGKCPTKVGRRGFCLETMVRLYKNFKTK
jgi:hypothetical protein